MVRPLAGETNRKRGRPKKLSGEAQNVNFFLEANLCCEIDLRVKASKGQYSSRSDFIRAALRRALKH